MNENADLVGRIEDGIVIDHLPPGTIEIVYSILHLRKHKGRIISADNIGSQRYGKKAFVKIEGRRINPRELAKLAILAPRRITINYIKEGLVIDKVSHLDLPDELVRVIRCPNPECISTKIYERLQRPETDAVMKVVGSDRNRVQCVYCEREWDIAEQFAEFRHFYLGD